MAGTLFAYPHLATSHQLSVDPFCIALLTRHAISLAVGPHLEVSTKMPFNHAQLQAIARRARAAFLDIFSQHPID